MLTVKVQYVKKIRLIACESVNVSKACGTRPSSQPAELEVELFGANGATVDLINVGHGSDHALYVYVMNDRGKTVEAISTDHCLVNR